MYAIIDCGTSTTRIYFIGPDHKIAASGRKSVGVRDTSITGSRDALRKGVTDLFFDVLAENNIPKAEIQFAVASGMITSEIGLIEIPHLVAPIGREELAANIVEVNDPAVLPIGCPVCFIRGIRNRYAENARAQDLREIDFMRGEEVQCVGILETLNPPCPCSIVTLSSHTKVIYIDESRRIVRSNTTISGQFFNALVEATNLGKSLVPAEGEQSGGYTLEELIFVAQDCVQNAGLGRTCLMARFMQVLLTTDSSERRTFIDAAIAADDVKAFREMRESGCANARYILYGQQQRCDLYAYILKKEFGGELIIETIGQSERIDELTVAGTIAVAGEYIRRRQNG